MANVVSIDPLETKMIEVVTQMQHGVAKIGEVLYSAAPQAVDAILAIKVISGIDQLVVGLICLIITVILGRVGMKHYRKRIENEFNEDNIGAIFIGVFLALGVFGFGIATAHHLLDIWNWVAVFQPKIAIAHDLLNIITGANDTCNHCKSNHN